MEVLIRDYEAEEKAWKEQVVKSIECASRPWPFNAPDFIPFADISCYREVDTNNLYFDRDGRIAMKETSDG